MSEHIINKFQEDLVLTGRQNLVFYLTKPLINLSYHTYDHGTDGNVL